VTTGSVVSSGGELIVNRFGSASGTVVSNGGVEIVGFGGRASGTTLLNGARETVSSGGIDSGTHVDSGSLETVVSGGVARGAIISGGTLDIRNGGSTGTGATTFATSGGGTLLLESSLTFSGLVAGFGKPDRLDFRDIAFTSGGTHATWTQTGTTSGTLAVTSGTETATLTLLGQYVAGDFFVRTDGHGGTIVTDPPVSAAQNVALVNPHNT
jgi:autotransporter passenger strand-loop-strand repeat protein